MLELQIHVPRHAPQAVRERLADRPGSGARGALADLVVNIAMLLVGGTTTLLAQRLHHRRSRPE
jgi:hypothetical protein